MTRGEKFSSTASAPAMSSSRSARPSSAPRSRVTPRLPALVPQNTGAHSHHWSVPGGRVLVKRMPSGRWTASTLTTSAPRAARVTLADGPAQKQVRSTTRTPVSGRSPRTPVVGVRPGVPVDRAGVLAQPGGGPEVRAGVVTEPVGDPGLAAVGAVDEDAAGHELLVVDHRRPVADGGDRHPQLGGPTDDLLGRVAGGPGLHGGLELLGPLGADVDVDQGLVGEQVAPLDEHEEVLELLVGDGGEADPAVGRRLDRGVVDVAERRLLGGLDAVELGEERAVGVHPEGHGLQDGQVDVLTDPRRPAHPPGGDGGQGGVHPGEVLAEAPPDGERWSVPAAPGARRPAGRLQRELRRRPVGPRPRQTVGRDRDDHQVGVVPPQPVGVQVGTAEDDIGAGGELLDPADHGPLGRVQEPEEGRVLALGQVDPGRRPPPQRVTLGALDLDDVGPGVGQQLGGVRPRHLRRPIEHPQAVQHRPSMADPPHPFVLVTKHARQATSFVTRTDRGPDVARRCSERGRHRVGARREEPTQRGDGND